MLIRSLLHVTGLLRSVIKLIHTSTNNKQTKKPKNKKSLPNKISLNLAFAIMDLRECLFDAGKRNLAVIP